MKQKPENKDVFPLEAFQAQLLKMDTEIFSSFLAKYPGNKEIKHRFIDMFENNRKSQLAILMSMTKEEKENPTILSQSRLQRIANGSGTTIKDFEHLLKQYKEMHELIMKIKSKPPDNDLPPAVAARMPIPEPPIITKAVGRKY